MGIQLYLAALSTAFEVLLGLQTIIVSHNPRQVRGGVFFAKDHYGCLSNTSDECFPPFPWCP